MTLATCIDTLPGIRAGAWADRTWAAQSRPGIRWIDAAGSRIRVRSAGSGSRRIVFATDPPNTVEHYDALFDATTPWAQAVCLELPGFGFSRAAPGFTFTVEANARAVCAVLEQLGDGASVLAFPCATGFVALRVAELSPHRVSHVVLQQTPGWPDLPAWSRRLDPHGVLGTPVLGQVLVRMLRRRIARGWYRVATGAPEPAAAFTTIADEAFAHGSAYALASIGQAFRRSPPPPALPPGIPGRVVWGALDRTHRKSDPRGACAYFPGGDCLAYADAGHFPELEQPERFAADLRAFVGG